MAGYGYKAVLADLDGTTNRGSVLIDGALDTYKKLTEKDVAWVFISNSATRLAKELSDRINHMGLAVSPNQVINSASVLLDEIARNYRGTKIFVIGEPPLVSAVRQSGADVDFSHDSAEIVVVAMDADFHYNKLNAAFQSIRKGARFWATNLDPTFPAEKGFVPGAGAIVASIANAIGKPPDRVFGKPERDMALLALKRLNVSAHECLVVGDRMDTDILFAHNAGMRAALVLTGAAAREQLSRYDYKPDYIFDSISGIQELFGEKAP